LEATLQINPSQLHIVNRASEKDVPPGKKICPTCLGGGEIRPPVMGPHSKNTSICPECNGERFLPK
jgi:DnaJ-class molecular chaperone